MAIKIREVRQIPTFMVEMDWETMNYIKNVFQNCPYGKHPNDEDPMHREIREDIFKSFTKILTKDAFKQR